MLCRTVEESMAGKKTSFTVNARRFDPYKNFKFRVAIGGLVSAIAGVIMLKKLLRPASQGEAEDYLTPPPLNDPPRPINSVGTSTARTARGAAKARPDGKAASPRARTGATRKTRPRKPR
jgi:hypothetical protein